MQSRRAIFRLDYSGARLSDQDWQKLKPVVTWPNNPDFPLIDVVSRYDIGTNTVQQHGKWHVTVTYHMLRDASPSDRAIPPKLPVSIKRLTSRCRRSTAIWKSPTWTRTIRGRPGRHAEVAGKKQAAASRKPRSSTSRQSKTSPPSRVRRSRSRRRDTPPQRGRSPFSGTNQIVQITIILKLSFFCERRRTCPVKFALDGGQSCISCSRHTR